MPNSRPEALRGEPRHTVIPFPDEAARPLRAAPGADERKGVILLFTGVRYERLDTDTVPTPPVASNGSRRRRS